MKKIEATQRVRGDSYTDFMVDILVMARENVDLLDGTIEPIKRLFEAGKIVIAVWDDPNKLSADSHVLNGWKLLREAFGQEYFSGVSVIPCQTFEQAVAIQQMFGTPDEDDEKEQLQPHRNDMLWPGVPLWTDAPPAPAEPTTMTVSHWLSFADAKNFYGVAVVDGDVEVCVANVLRDAAKLGCIVPFFHYSKVAMQKLPPDLIPEHYKNRLLTKVEAKRLLTSVIKTESSNK
jgi:hypothetical protein